MYEQDSLSALDAITEAQRIAFAPMLFQTALCLRNAGVLTWLDKQGKRGATLNEITENSTINEYAASILLDMGLSGRIITHKEGYYYLAKVGHFLLHDTMTRVNMDFTQDVCYQGLFYLENALKDGKPAGLKFLATGQQSILRYHNYRWLRVKVGLLLIITIQMAHLMPHCHMYSPAPLQPCTMSVEIPGNGHYVVVSMMTILQSPS